MYKSIVTSSSHELLLKSAGYILQREDLEALAETIQHGIDTLDMDNMDAVDRLQKMADAINAALEEDKAEELRKHPREFQNITVKLDDAEGDVDRVESFKKWAPTSNVATIRSMLGMLWDPRETLGYTKVYLLISTGGGEPIRVRRDMALDEATPESIIEELKQHDAEATA